MVEARCLQLALQLGRQREQLESAHLAVLGAMLVQVGQRPPSFSAVDLHPPPADLDEVGAVLGGAAQHIVGHGCVVDDHLPVDQGRCREAAAASSVLRLGGGASGGAPASELLGSEQLDADGGERIDALQRRGRSVEIDPVRYVADGAADPFGKLGHGRSDGRGRSIEPTLQQRDESGLVRECERSRPTDHHVVRGAPAPTIVAVDELEAERPLAAVVAAGWLAVEQLVAGLLAWQAQAQPHAHDGFAFRPASDERELGGDVCHRFAQFGSDRELPGVGDERAADQAHGARVDRPRVGEHGAPPPCGEREPAQPIDHRAQHVDRVDRRRRCNHGGHGREQGGLRQLDIAGERLPLCQPPHVGDVREHRQHPPVHHQLGGEAVHGAEPGHRCAEIGAQRIELAQRCEGDGVEPLTHHVDPPIGQRQRHHTSGAVVGHAGPACDACHLVVQVAAVHAAAGLPRDGLAIDPAELQPGGWGANGHSVECTKRVRESGPRREESRGEVVARRRPPGGRNRGLHVNLLARAH